MNWLLIIFIIVVLVVFGLGFVVKWLFWIALALFVVWIITLLVDRLRRR
ncbi:MAG: hydrophobic protein [Thermoleophilia bacterium]|nr:hydrophobic protein [Thermoleophilia bacterium]